MCAHYIVWHNLLYSLHLATFLRCQLRTMPYNTGLYYKFYGKCATHLLLEARTYKTHCVTSINHTVLLTSNHFSNDSFFFSSLFFYVLLLFFGRRIWFLLQSKLYEICMCSMFLLAYTDTFASHLPVRNGNPWNCFRMKSKAATVKFILQVDYMRNTSWL